jgi:transposase-like protein
MSRKNRKWTTEEKVRIVKRYLNLEGSLSSIAKEEAILPGQLSNWTKKFNKFGVDGLINKPRGQFSKIVNKKNPTREELLEYENFKLRMENELLKKGLDPERVMRIARKKKDTSMK